MTPHLIGWTKVAANNVFQPTHSRYARMRG